MRLPWSRDQTGGVGAGGPHIECVGIRIGWEPLGRTVGAHRRSRLTIDPRKGGAVRTFSSAADITAAVGDELGTSDWVTVTQERVNQFAEATGDHQWIHVDPERAARESPFGGPIAHGYLSLSLLPMLGWQIYTVANAKLGINYGSNKVRFPAPVPVGSEVRLRATLQSADAWRTARFRWWSTRSSRSRITPSPQSSPRPSPGSASRAGGPPRPMMVARWFSSTSGWRHPRWNGCLGRRLRDAERR